MTDDRIKEEFENWLEAHTELVYDRGEKKFIRINDHIVVDYRPVNIRNLQATFESMTGCFRSVERLAKIEVLEELNKQICLQDTNPPEYMDFDTYMKVACDNINESLRIINNMLSDLKGEQ